MSCGALPVSPARQPAAGAAECRIARDAIAGAGDQSLSPLLKAQADSVDGERVPTRAVARQSRVLGLGLLVLLLSGCESNDVTVSEHDVRVQAMGRWIVKDCDARGAAPTGSPWRCSVAGAPEIAGDYTVNVTSDGAFRVEGPHGSVMSRGCCLDVARE